MLKWDRLLKPICWSCLLLLVLAYLGNFSVLLYARSQLWRKNLQPPLKNPRLYFGPMRYFHFKIPGCSVLRYLQTCRIPTCSRPGIPSPLTPFLACFRIQEHKHQAELAKLETRREGEEIQRLNQLYQLEIQRGRENEQEEKLELQRQHHEHVAEQKVIKDEEKQREDQDDDRIRAYIRGKEMMADLRREADAETSRLVQEHQDKAFQQLAGQMNQTLRMEAERFARGAAEVEDEYQMKTKEREAKNKAAIESIAEHRATVVKMKLEKEIEDKAENEKECHAFMEKNRIYLEGEEAKKQRQRDASVEVQKIQLQQMAEKKAKKEQEKQADLDYDAQREAAFCKEQKFWR